MSWAHSLKESMGSISIVIDCDPGDPEDARQEVIEAAVQEIYDRIDDLESLSRRYKALVPRLEWSDGEVTLIG